MTLDKRPHVAIDALDLTPSDLGKVIDFRGENGYRWGGRLTSIRHWTLCGDIHTELAIDHACPVRVALGARVKVITR